MIKRKRKVIFTAGLGIVFISLIYWMQFSFNSSYSNEEEDFWRSNKTLFLREFLRAQSSSTGTNNWTNPRCPDVLTGLTTGHWVTRPLTPMEQAVIGEYLQESRGALKIPDSFQRDDGRCGNVSYTGVTHHKHMLFRALCDPLGHTPCCYTNRCTPSSIADCSCSTCYDERKSLHSEFSRWQPSDERCWVSHFSNPQACKVLEGMTIVFVGDSFIRHIFAALVVLLTNPIDGALRKNTTKVERRKCMGMQQITGEKCRPLLAHERQLCGGKVNVSYVQIFSAAEFPAIILPLRSLRHLDKSMMILGLGVHNNFNLPALARRFLLPLLNLHQFLPTDLIDIVEPSMLVKQFETFNFNSLNFGINNTGKTNSSTRYTIKPNSSDSSFDNINNYTRKPSSFYSRIFQKRRLDWLTFSALPSPEVDRRLLRPRLLWVGAHAPGLLKSPEYWEQSAPGVQSFNRKTRDFLDRWQVPILETYNFTQGVVSFDGTHYGWGINMLKAKLILSYILQENNKFNSREVNKERRK